jgi:hypothetical protein
MIRGVGWQWVSRSGGKRMAPLRVSGPWVGVGRRRFDGFGMRG